MNKAKHQEAIVRNLYRGIATQEEIDALRRVNPALAQIAEQQNAAARTAIAKAKGGAQ